jgi:chromate transport protein ChrA
MCRSILSSGTALLWGPVVIPLLRSYVVNPGWVSSRDFLIGLAIILAFPGPNFNFAVFLGALALQRTRLPNNFCCEIRERWHSKGDKT